LIIFFFNFHIDECDFNHFNIDNIYIYIYIYFILTSFRIQNIQNLFYEIFPECLSNDLYKKWNDVDIINMKKCNIFLERNDLPNIFDVLLLDGGEFTTYYEFQLLKNRCKYLLLDDINVAKCTKIVEEIKNEPEKWKIIIENTNIRNGFMVCINLYV
jgi:hypothetical protein